MKEKREKGKHISKNAMQWQFTSLFGFFKNIAMLNMWDMGFMYHIHAKGHCQHNVMRFV